MNHIPLPLSGPAQPHKDLTSGANKWMALLVVTIGAFMSNLDASIVNISLPSIAHTFDTSLNGFQWAMLVCALLAALGIFTSLVRGQEHLTNVPEQSSAEKETPASSA